MHEDGLCDHMLNRVYLNNISLLKLFNAIDLTELKIYTYFYGYGFRFC